MQGVDGAGDPLRAWMDAQPPTEEPAEPTKAPAAASLLNIERFVPVHSHSRLV